jgi:hypothetical protein
MGAGADQAGHYADVLAKASAASNASIAGLGEAMKYVAPTAKELGIPFEDATAALGKLADAGLKGTLGGTGLAMSFQRLAAPTRQASALMEKYHIGIAKNAQGQISLSGTFKAVAAGLDKVKDKEERLAILSTIFGSRAAKAAGILTDSAKDAGEHGLDPLIKTLVEADGDAKRMADTRLDNFLGQATLLKNAFETFNIEVFQPLLNTLTPGLKMASAAVGGVARAMGLLSTGGIDAEAELFKLGPTIRSIAEGVRAGIATIGQFITDVRAKFLELGDTISSSLGSEGVASIAKIVTIATFAAAAITPIVGAVAAVGFVFASIIVPIVSGLGTVFSGLIGIITGPFGIAIGAVIGILLLLQNENESFMDTALRVWGVVRDAIMSVWTNAISPFIQGFVSVFIPSWEQLKIVGADVKESLLYVFSELFSFFSDKTTQTATDWLEVGTTIGSIVAAAIQTVVQIVGFLIKVLLFAGQTIIKIGSFVYDYLALPFVMVFNLVKQAGTAILQLLSGDLTGGFKRLGLAILDFLLEPLRAILKTFIRISDLAHMPVPQSVRDFVDKELAAPVLLTKKAANEPGAPTDALEAGTKAKVAGKADVNVSVKPTDVKLGDQHVTLNLDGKVVAKSVVKQQVEFNERSGVRATRWQRTAYREGAAVAPVRTGG